MEVAQVATTFKSPPTQWMYEILVGKRAQPARRARLIAATADLSAPQWVTGSQQAYKLALRARPPALAWLPVYNQFVRPLSRQRFDLHCLYRVQ